MNTQPVCLPFAPAPMGAPPTPGGPSGGGSCPGGRQGGCGGGTGGGGGCNGFMSPLPDPVWIILPSGESLSLHICEKTVR